MAIKKKKVKGEDKGKVLIYTLSTCIWCRKTKNLLKDLNVEYSYVDVDLLNKGDREEVMDDMKKYNPKKGFPTMIINKKETIIGFDESKIRKYFGE